MILLAKERKMYPIFRWKISNPIHLNSLKKYIDDIHIDAVRATQQFDGQHIDKRYFKNQTKLNEI